MSNRWVEINCSLRLCRKVFAILKQKNPDLLPDHIDILAYRKDSKKCHFYDGMKTKAEGNEDDHDWIAHFDQPFLMPSHICIKQDFLFFPFGIPTSRKDYGPRSSRKKKVLRRKFCKGNWIVIEVSVHEISHYVHLGHGEDFFKIYHKFLSQMAQVVISGEFYHWYSRQHQSKINDVEDATKEWVDSHLAWTQHLPGLFWHDSWNNSVSMPHRRWVASGIQTA